MSLRVLPPRSWDYPICDKHSTPGSHLRIYLPDTSLRKPNVIWFLCFKHTLMDLESSRIVVTSQPILPKEYSCQAAGSTQSLRRRHFAGNVPSPVCANRGN